MKSHYANFYLDCDMKHGLNKGDEDTSTAYLTNFGLPVTVDLSTVNDYIAARTAVFFQAILNGTVGSFGGTSKFISCEDFRFSAGACAIEKYNDGCKGNDTCAKNPEEEYSKYLIIKKN